MKEKSKAGGSFFRLISYVAIIVFLLFLTIFKLTLNVAFCWLAAASIVVSAISLFISLISSSKEDRD